VTQEITAPRPDADLLAEIADLRRIVAEAGGLGWRSLDEFQREMRDE
jgi:hypothetical protein